MTPEEKYNFWEFVRTLSWLPSNILTSTLVDSIAKRFDYKNEEVLNEFRRML